MCQPSRSRSDFQPLILFLPLMASSLPIEIWSNIVHIILSHHPYSESIRTLSRLSAVSHALSAECSRVIYTAPRVPICAYTAFFRCISTSARICGLIRALRIFPPEQGLQAFDVGTEERRAIERLGTFFYVSFLSDLIALNHAIGTGMMCSRV